LTAGRDQGYGKKKETNRNEQHWSSLGITIIVMGVFDYFHYLFVASRAQALTQPACMCLSECVCVCVWTVDELHYLEKRADWDKKGLKLIPGGMGCQKKNWPKAKLGHLRSSQ
jgi:hypothetical protein